VELGEAGRHHVGQMQVAGAALGCLVHPAAVALDPFAVARGHLVLQQVHQNIPASTGTGKRQLHLGARLVHEQRRRGPLAAHALSVHRHDALAGARLDADGIERRVGAVLPAVARGDVHDLGCAGLRVDPQIGS
jgi:hypothetical protein